jgi:hypothetical protein
MVALITSSSLPQKAATGCQNYRSSLLPSRLIWPAALLPLPTGFRDRLPRRIRIACGVAPPSQTCQLPFQGEFEKRRWFLATCLRAFGSPMYKLSCSCLICPRNELFPKIYSEQASESVIILTIGLHLIILAFHLPDTRVVSSLIYKIDEQKS